MYSYKLLLEEEKADAVNRSSDAGSDSDGNAHR